MAPCDAERWEDGAHWNADGSIDDSPNAPDTLGILRPGNSNIGSNPPEISETVTVTYPFGVNHNITMTPSGSGANCDPIALVGPAPDCGVQPPCTIFGPPSICPGSAAQYCGPAGLSGYSWSISGPGGTIIGASDGQCVNVAGVNNCNTTFTLTLVTGSIGSTDTCTQTVAVSDLVPPVFTFCPGGGALGCNPPGIPAEGPAAATDGCSAVTISSSLSTVNKSGCSRSQTRTYLATDACGNTATCTQVFTWVLDTVGPMITSCPMGGNLGCNPTGIPGPGLPTGTDGCGAVTFTSYLSSVGFFGCLRSQTRTYVATDACGNISTCQQVFTWTVDNSDPVITYCPPGADLGCNPAGIPGPGPATASDNCGVANISSSLGVMVTDGCNRSQTRTYVATDFCGNTATCTQVFTWTVDNSAPVFSYCPPGANLGCNPAGIPAEGQAIATDGCSAVTITTSVSPIAKSGCNRSQTRTYLATDACGNTATCTQVFTWVLDTVGPMITSCPMGGNLGCNPAGIPGPGQPTATDGCSAVTFTSYLTSVGFFGCLRSQTRVYVATDACGNTSTCSQIFTWTVDNSAPVFTYCPPGVNLGCNPAGIPGPGPATASDNCGVANISSSLGVMVTDGCNRSQTRTYVATDFCGNTTTCTQVFTWVEDTSSPAFTYCPPGVNLGCNPSGVPGPGPATATDNCGVVNISSSLGAIVSDGCLRTQTRTYVATDGCNNTASCVQVFTWTQDTYGPVFSYCPPGANLGCNPTGIPAPGPAAAADGCSAVTITSSLGAIVENGCNRTQTRTYLATDVCGNTAVCTQVFTWILDTNVPVFSYCPPGADLGCNPTGVPGPGTATATDGCSAITYTSSLGNVIVNGCNRTQTRTYVATDACGNTASCTQVFTWTQDIYGPVFTYCPPGANLGCNPSGVPGPGPATATDNCGAVSISSSLGAIVSDGCLRTQARTYVATDGCNNTATCVQVFTWTQDTYGPVFSYCPPGANLGCNPSGIPAPGPAAAADGCSAVTITSSLGAVVEDGCNRTQTRTYVATDVCGNAATCAQVFTWTVDNSAPVFTYCPPGADLGCNPTSGTPAAGQAMATDGCSAVTITSSLGTVAINGCNRSQTRTYVATDVCGNTATCIQVFTWTQDTYGAVFTYCPPGANLGCNPGSIPPPGPATATDACSAVVITSYLGQVTSDGCFRTQTRTYVATDGCGNASTCAQVFTWIEDTGGPTFTYCPPGSDLGCNPPTGIPGPGQASATDGCSSPVISSTLGSIVSNGCNRSQTRTYVATDACGNTSTCAQVFTWVQDNTGPVFTFCPADADLGCSPTGVPGPGPATATDACSTPVITSTLGSIISNGCNRSQTRTYLATDACGNTSTCTQTFTWVVDGMPPVITFCPPGADLGCNPVNLPAPGTPTISYGCSAPVITSTLGSITSNGCSRSQTRTYLATDACGNTASCTQVFTWTEDVTPPVISNPPASIAVECDDVIPPAPVLTATDNCSGPVPVNFSTMQIPGDCPNSYTLVRSWTAIDNCNNIAVVNQSIVIYDDTPPSFLSVPDNINWIECPGPVPPPAVVTAVDKCTGSVPVTFTEWIYQAQGDCISTYRVYRKWVAYDACGNLAEVTRWIQINDTQAPVFTFVPADTSLDCRDLDQLPVAIAKDACCLGEVVQTQTVNLQISGNGIIYIERKWVATDCCGNTSLAKQKIALVDTIAPILVNIPPNITINEGSPIPPPPMVWAEDKCPFNYPLTVVYTQAMDTLPDGTVIIVRTWTVCDMADNCATGTQVITIVPFNTPPYFVHPIVIPDSVHCELLPLNMLANVQAWDVETNAFVPVTLDEQLSPYECGNGIIGTWTWTATDPEGASTTYTTTDTIIVTGECLGEYCMVIPGNAGVLWISKFGLDSYLNLSFNEGYGNFTSPPIQVVKGGIYQQNMSASLMGPLQPVKWAMWADWNHDGDFNDTEEFYDLGTLGLLYSGVLHIPLFAKAGSTRLRVAVSQSAEIQACGIQGVGEYEDYTLFIKGLDCPNFPCVVQSSDVVSNFDYLKQVVFSNVDNTSGKTQYSDFTYLVANVNRGQGYNVQLKSNSLDGYQGLRYWNMLADWNRDGDYDDLGEAVVNTSGTSYNLNQLIGIPLAAFPGKSVVRVIVSRQPINDYCDVQASGETEDYMMYVQPIASDSLVMNATNDPELEFARAGTGLLVSHRSENNDLPLRVQPNPTTGNVKLTVWLGEALEWKVRVMDANGNQVYFNAVQGIAGENAMKFNLSDLPNGVYTLFVQWGDTRKVGKLVVIH